MQVINYQQSFTFVSASYNQVPNSGFALIEMSAPTNTCTPRDIISGYESCYPNGVVSFLPNGIGRICSHGVGKTLLVSIVLLFTF